MSPSSVDLFKSSQYKNKKIFEEISIFKNFILTKQFFIVKIFLILYEKQNFYN
jgi:hypothetical protein